MIGNTSIPASVTQRGNASAAAHQRFSSGNGRAFSSSRPSSGIPADLLQNLLQLVQSLIQQLGGGSQQSGKSAESTLQGDNGSGEGDQAGGAPQSDEGTSTAPPQTTYPQVALTDTERQALESLTGLTGIRVDDLDNSGTLSAGDVVVGSDPTAMKHDLTAEEIAATQPKPSPQPLELSVDQLNAIANFFNDGPTAENPGRIKTEFTGQATDNNGDGQLGVGDSVQLKDSSGGFELVHDYVLTESELKGINELLAGSGLPAG